MAFNLPLLYKQKIMQMEISQLIEVIPGIIIFRIAELEFCINVKDVHVIKRMEESEPLIENPLDDLSYMKIYNINIPLIDISKYFDTSNEKSCKRKIVLIIKQYSDEEKLEKTFGILVDDVVEIISADKSENNYLLKFTPSNNNPFLSGMISINGRNVLIPNYSKIASALFQKLSKVQ